MAFETISILVSIAAVAFSIVTAIAFKKKMNNMWKNVMSLIAETEIKRQVPKAPKPVSEVERLQKEIDDLKAQETPSEEPTQPEETEEPEAPVQEPIDEVKERIDLLEEKIEDIKKMLKQEME
ncbi:hypothetical protein LCGC14_0535250 [marine sediment metagenome]|uniref:Uncharacterized protein n=1 Tax=marine sediment metagenome TaxID=412755 RepID=A0A0F9SCW3_9ZZZZ